MVSSKKPHYDDDSHGIARYTRHDGRRTPTGPLRPIRRLEPSRPLDGHPGERQGIPRAPSIREDVADMGTAELPPRPHVSEMMQPRFYVDETVMLQQAKKEIEELERMNQRMRRPYEIGTQVGVYTDYLQINCAHDIGQATQLLITARRSKQAYLERHAYDDPPEGA